MNRLLRTDLDELEAYVTQISAATGIPPAHIEKDYWVTEILRGVATVSVAAGSSIVFKAGTSLMGVHHLIQRFSEDVDLIAVLPAGTKGDRDRTLKAFMDGAETTTGIRPAVDPNTTTKGEKRTAVLSYNTAHSKGSCVLEYDCACGLYLNDPTAWT